MSKRIEYAPGIPGESLKVTAGTEGSADYLETEIVVPSLSETSQAQLEEVLEALYADEGKSGSELAKEFALVQLKTRLRNKAAVELKQSNDPTFGLAKEVKSLSKDEKIRMREFLKSLRGE
jgi:hypothetical protein